MKPTSMALKRRVDQGGLTLGSSLLSLGLEHSLHFLPLALGKVVGADALLQELEAPLLLANSEQLLGTLLVRGKPNNLCENNDVSIFFKNLL